MRSYKEGNDFMIKAKDGDTVKVHYIAKAEEEVIFDSETANPLQLTIGKNEILPTLEEALIGMSLGESKTIQVSSEDAFGPYIKELVSKIPRKDIPSNLELKIGQQLQIQDQEGHSILVTIKELDEKEAMLDANHPLAGKDLTFSIELLEIA